MSNDETNNGESNESEKREAAQEASVAITPGLVLGDKYEIVCLIGRGGMGSVYEAREIDFEIDRTVAVKVLSQSMLSSDENMAERRFRDEIKILAQMNHPNIVPVFNVGRFGSSLFFVMNYIEGITLNDFIRKAGPLQEADIRKIGKQVAGAIGHIHKIEAIHRDIKSNNIMVNQELRATLMDFGIAKSKDAQTRLTAEGQVLGTGPYLSPEQWDGKVDHRSDIYAFGVVLYEMAAGRLPFDSDSIPQLMNMILQQQEADLKTLRPELSRHLCDLIHRCMKKDPDERPQSMEEVRRELVDFKPEEESEKAQDESMPVVPNVPSPQKLGVASMPSTPAPDAMPAQQPPRPRPAPRDGKRPRRTRKKSWIGRIIKVLILLIVAVLVLSWVSPSVNKKVKVYKIKAKTEIHKIWKKVK